MQMPPRRSFRWKGLIWKAAAPRRSFHWKDTILRTGALFCTTLRLLKEYTEHGDLSSLNLVLSFNDWTIFSRDDNIPHDIKSPRFVGILAPVKNDSLRRSGFMQIYGLVADRKYVPGPYKEYRAALYAHTSNFTTDGLDVTWTHDDYRIKQAESVGEFNLTVSHRRTAVKRAIAQRPNVAVYSSSDPSIERFYQEDLILDVPHTPAMTTSNVKDFSLNCTMPHLSEVMAGSKLGGMIYNPNYLRDVYERVPGPAS